MSVPFYSPELSRSSIEVSEPRPENLEPLQAILASDLLQEEIQKGNVTVAMIRPELIQSSTLDGTDSEIADRLEKEIQFLGVLGKFAIRFDAEAVNEFYAGPPRDIQLEYPPMRKTNQPTRWDEFESIMLDGPTTVLLLWDPDGQAIEKWRGQVGHWNIEAHRDMDTLRGRFGTDNYNNLVHGSDSPTSAEREVNIIRECIARNFQPFIS